MEGRFIAPSRTRDFDNPYFRLCDKRQPITPAEFDAIPDEKFDIAFWPLATSRDDNVVIRTISTLDLPLYTHLETRFGASQVAQLSSSYLTPLGELCKAVCRLLNDRYLVEIGRNGEGGAIVKVIIHSDDPTLEALETASRIAKAILKAAPMQVNTHPLSYFRTPLTIIFQGIRLLAFRTERVLMKPIWLKFVAFCQVLVEAGGKIQPAEETLAYVPALYSSPIYPATLARTSTSTAKYNFRIYLLSFHCHIVLCS